VSAAASHSCAAGRLENTVWCRHVWVAGVNRNRVWVAGANRNPEHVPLHPSCACVLQTAWPDHRTAFLLLCGRRVDACLLSPGVQTLVTDSRPFDDFADDAAAEDQTCASAHSHTYTQKQPVRQLCLAARGAAQLCGAASWFAATVLLSICRSRTHLKGCRNACQCRARDVDVFVSVCLCRSVCLISAPPALGAIAHAAPLLSTALGWPIWLPIVDMLREGLCMCATEFCACRGTWLQPVTCSPDYGCCLSQTASLLQGPVHTDAF
jgi:hypothetical protein